MIRRPQQFKPATGTLVDWRLENAANGVLITSGTTVVGADDLVSVAGLRIPRDPGRARVIIALPPPAPFCNALTLYARLLTNSMLELRWEACTNYDYQLEASLTLTNWRNAGPPLAAPPGGGWLTNLVSTTNRAAFFRVRADLLTNSIVPSTPGNYTNLFMTADGLLRNYRLMIPTNYNPAVSNAFAFVLHGHGQTADSFAALHPALLADAQTNGLILALPNSTDDERGTGWNNFDLEPGQYVVNDVSFLTALIEQLDATLTLDRRRLYAGGFSSGGVMCHYLGARTTNLFAALAMVEASIGTAKGTGTIATNPPAAGPMPVFLLNCTNSCTRPYYGGVSSDGTLVTAAIDAARYWTNANVCAAAMTAVTNTIVSSNIFRFESCGKQLGPSQSQTNQVITQRWASCTPGTEVIFVTLTDGGHVWPDPGDNLGFDANAEVLRLFLAHSRP